MDTDYDLCEIYVVLIKETMDSFFIKVGKSTSLGGRISSYKSICPDLKLLAKKTFRSEKEYELIHELSNHFIMAGQELVKVFKHEVDLFIRVICNKLSLSGVDNYIDFSPLNGCKVSHHKGNNFTIYHSNCEIKCYYRRQCKGIIDDFDKKLMELSKSVV